MDPAVPTLPTVQTDLSRVGVIDVGSNSIRLVVFDGAARSPAYFFNEKVLCGLGAGLAATGTLSAVGWDKALVALRRFVTLAERMKVSTLIGVATAAVREADNGAEFAAMVLEQTGLDLRVVQGVEEARLSAQGVLVGWPSAVGLVVDIGGASMELARVHGGRIGTCLTSNLAPLSLQDIPAHKVDAHIAKTLKKLREKMPGAIEEMFLVGGSWRAIANLHMARNDYPLAVLHGYETTPEAFMETVEWVAEQTPENLSGMTSTSDARLALTPIAAQVLRQLIPVFSPDKIAISSYGLREGVLFEVMDSGARALDPLIEAARHMERASARFPGFGDALFDWILPLFPEADGALARLIEAACLMHDINWRTHPDFRPEASFEAVTRANLGGVSHRERVMIGFALAHRYKSGRRARPEEALLSLLSEQDMQVAEQLGRALRLGAMLTGASADALDHAKLALSAEYLTLTLVGDMADLAGEAVDKRLSRLARVMGREAQVITN